MNVWVNSTYNSRLFKFFKFLFFYSSFFYDLFIVSALQILLEAALALQRSRRVSWCEASMRNVKVILRPVDGLILIFYIQEPHSSHTLH
jgi:hypothetical protein